MAQMDGKVAIVTGGSSGIGRASALLFAREGARVVVADVDADGGEETVRMIKESGGEGLFLATDVARAADAEAMVEQTIDAFGRLDYALNNAGLEPLPCTTADVPEDDWDQVMAVNLKGVYLCMKYEIPKILDIGTGAIVNMSSGAGLGGVAFGAAYSASKHGVIGLTRSAALDYAPWGIRVNAICPGVVRTPTLERYIDALGMGEEPFVTMEPVGRMGTPIEIAEMVVWLCSDASSFVTGAAIPVDGGLTAKV